MSYISSSEKLKGDDELEGSRRKDDARKRIKRIKNRNLINRHREAEISARGNRAEMLSKISHWPLAESKGWNSH